MKAEAIELQAELQNKTDALYAPLESDSGMMTLILWSRVSAAAVRVEFDDSMDMGRLYSRFESVLLEAVLCFDLALNWEMAAAGARRIVVREACEDAGRNCNIHMRSCI